MDSLLRRYLKKKEENRKNVSTIKMIFISETQLWA